MQYESDMGYGLFHVMQCQNTNISIFDSFYSQCAFRLELPVSYHCLALRCWSTVCVLQCYFKRVIVVTQCTVQQLNLCLVYPGICQNILHPVQKAKCFFFFFLQLIIDLTFTATITGYLALIMMLLTALSFQIRHFLVIIRSMRENFFYNDKYPINEIVSLSQ